MFAKFAFVKTKFQFIRKTITTPFKSYFKSIYFLNLKYPIFGSTFILNSLKKTRLKKRQSTQLSFNVYYQVQKILFLFA